MPWYAVHIKPKQEERASSCLAGAGLDVFLPRIEVRRKRGGHGASQVELLFPQYFFVSTSLTPRIWETVRWTPGVKAILGCDGVPSPIPEAVIASIKQRVGADGVIEPKAMFAPGDQVRIKDGPFAGLTGIMERVVSRSGRVQVLLDLLRGASLELEDVDLEFAS